MREVLKQLSNRELEILNIIQKKGSVTKKDLQAITGTKLTTLNRAMKTLEDKKLIVESGISESTGGRKAIEYAVAESGIYTIGIDISRTYVKIIVANLKMTILKEKQFTMDSSLSPEKTVRKTSSLLEEVLSDLSINKSEVIGIGIGSVGPLNREKGILLNPKNFFNKAWSNVPLKELIEKNTSIPCFLDNGANTAVLAEYLFGMGKGLKSVVYIHCGIGIRSAVITDGIIVRTINNAEDAFAHMIVDINGEDCICGNRGCIESYASIEAIINKFMLKSKETDSKCILKNIKNENYKELLKLAAHDNKLALEIINKGAEALGVGLANLVRILNPQLVILCGPLIKNYEPFFNMCIDTFNKSNCLNNEVTFSSGGSFKEDAIAIGACVMVVEHYLKNT